MSSSCSKSLSWTPVTPTMMMRIPQLLTQPTATHCSKFPLVPWTCTQALLSDSPRLSPAHTSCLPDATSLLSSSCFPYLVTLPISSPYCSICLVWHWGLCRVYSPGPSFIAPVPNDFTPCGQKHCLHHSLRNWQSELSACERVFFCICFLLLEITQKLFKDREHVFCFFV